MFSIFFHAYEDWSRHVQRNKAFGKCRVSQQFKCIVREQMVL